MNDAVFKVKVTQGSNMATKGFLLRPSFQNPFLKRWRKMKEGNDEREAIERFF